MKRLLTLAEAAQALNISKNHIYRLVWSGALETVKIGRAARWRAEDIERVAKHGAEAARHAPRTEAKK